ncbi:hypothetical protein GOODEAATRI_031627 [Goodea atripinnis]|uniref:Uncharacterized protein n=1 Tax=Goodea atripinnis TaxID=208336 RepID=A0ABV0P9D1_9TELE
MVANQMCEHLDSNHLFEEFQSGDPYTEALVLYTVVPGWSPDPGHLCCMSSPSIHPASCLATFEKITRIKGQKLLPMAQSLWKTNCLVNHLPFMALNWPAVMK